MVLSIFPLIKLILSILHFSPLNMIVECNSPLIRSFIEIDNWLSILPFGNSSFALLVNIVSLSKMRLTSPLET